MGEITLELHLDFQIPESGLAINGLIGGLKEAAGQIHGEILVSLMQALEERLIDTMIQNEPERSISGRFHSGLTFASRKCGDSFARELQSV